MLPSMVQMRRRLWSLSGASSVAVSKPVKFADQNARPASPKQFSRPRFWRPASPALLGSIACHHPRRTSMSVEIVSLLVAKNQRRNRLSRPLSTEKLCSADLFSRYTRMSRRLSFNPATVDEQRGGRH
jgi:hypothetical protein